ncbi:MAG: MFS transporter [Gammaproteobacteria bacterium]|nr:MFS transporter [Gammaproteobacteria bacterium]
MENVTQSIKESAIIIFAGLGMFLSTLDTGIINVALPTLEQKFHTNITTISWVVTLYTLVLSSTIVVFGRLSDRYGRVRFYRIGLWIFTLSSLLCGAAYSACSLIFFRGMQGIGAALLQATAMALITTFVAPERRGIALGTMGSMIGLGPILGPTLGGFILSSIGWRWIFWINLPLCLIGLFWSRHLPNRFNRNACNLNLSGIFFFSTTILSFIWALSIASQIGLKDFKSLGLLGLAIVSAALCRRFEKSSKQPIVALPLFKKPEFVLPMVATVAFGVASAIIFMIPPFFLEKLHHFSPWQTGLVVFCAPLGVVLFSRLSGKLIHYFGTMILMTVGLLCMLLALIGLALLSFNWSPFVIAGLLFLYGMGGGLFQTPSISAIMGLVEEAQQGTIGAVNRMVQNASIALGATVASTMVAFQINVSNEKLITGFQHAWWFALAFIAVALCCFMWFFIKKIKTTSYIDNTA